MRRLDCLLMPFWSFLSFRGWQIWPQGHLSPHSRPAWTVPTHLRLRLVAGKRALRFARCWFSRLQLSSALSWRTAALAALFAALPL
jgi:hypothetical protein